MGRPKAFIREEVIQKAMLIFWEKGYSATSLSDLTEITGLNKKSLYNEFGSKHELFEVVLDHYNDMKSYQVDILLKEPLGKDNVVHYLKDLASTVDSKGCLLALSLNENNLLTEEAKFKSISSFEGLESLIQRNLKADYKAAKANSLSLLMSSTMFSTAALGKLKYDKAEIKKMINQLILLLE